MKYRRINSLLLVFALVLLMAVVPVSASREDDAREALRDAMEAEMQTLDISEYDLSLEELEALMEQMRVRNEWPWYMDHYISSYYTNSSSIDSVEFVYHDPAQYDRTVYEQALNEILARTIHPGMSQWQMALSLHDYLAVHCAYDEELVKRDAYSVISNGMAVCEGYSAIYQDLLNMVGIESILCISEGMNHAWNMVKIDGQWYHVDVTWDDPVTDCHGRALHSYFLIGDTTIADAEHAHYGWVIYEKADDEQTMKDAFWLDIDSPICYESASVSYFCKDDGAEHRIYRRNENTGELTELAVYGGNYINFGSGEYHYGHYGLSLWNGRLYFSDMEHLYSMKTDGTDMVTEYTHDARASGTYIQGAMVDKGVAYLTFSTPDDRKTSEEITLESGYRDHTHAYETVEITALSGAADYILYMCSCGDSYTEAAAQTDATEPQTAETEAAATEPAQQEQDQEPDTEPDREEPGQDGFPWIWVIAAAALVVLVIVVKILLAVRKASRPSKTMPPVYDDWVM